MRQQIRQYHIDQFEITVNSAAYLVAVREADSSNTNQDAYTDLPRWVFESKHAIWYADEVTNSMYEKASKGDRIRQRLMKQLL